MTECNTQFQELALRVSYICNLETGGKLSPQEAYSQIETLLINFDSFIIQLGQEKSKSK